MSRRYKGTVEENVARTMAAHDDAYAGDALSRALVQQHPGLAGHVHYVNGRPWCDGVNHTTMCTATCDKRQA